MPIGTAGTGFAGFGYPGTGGGGAPPIPALPGDIECQQPSLDVPWAVVATCEPGSTSLSPGHLEFRCPFSKHLNFADYGPFVACCPRDRPYACANSTPWQCFATPNQAAASCGEQDCVACSPFDADQSAGGHGGGDGSAGYGGAF